MFDEDPFASVIKPERENKKMSTYLKKQRRAAELMEQGVIESSPASVGSHSHNSRGRRQQTPSFCDMEEKSLKSHNTETTRSTTVSNCTEDFHGTPSRHNSRSESFSGFGNFDEDEGDVQQSAATFDADFGNGLEFGGGGGDAFGTFDAAIKEDEDDDGISANNSKDRRSSGRSIRSSSGSSRSDRPSKPPRQSSSGSRHSGNSVSSGRDRTPQSMRDFGRSDTSRGGVDRTTGCHQSTSTRDLQNNDNGFGSFDPFNDDGQVDLASPFSVHDEEEAPLNFGDDGGDAFGSNIFGDGFGSSGDKGAAAWKKREEWKRSNQSGSSSSSGGSRERRGGERPRRGETKPRRSLSEVGVNSSEREEAESPGSAKFDRQLSRRNLPPAQPPTRNRNGLGHQRSMRRSSMDPSGPLGQDSGHMETSNGSRSHTQLRRSSVTHTRSDGSLEGNILALNRRAELRRQPGLPQRNKSSGGTSMDPKPAPADKKWNRDRSRNQDLIMSMYRDSGLTKKSDHSLSNHDLSNSDELDGSVMDGLALEDVNQTNNRSSGSGFGNIIKKSFGGSATQFGASLDDAEDEPSPKLLAASTPKTAAKDRRSALSALRMSKKKDISKDDENQQGYAEARKMQDRSRASLLERVGADDTLLSQGTSSRGLGSSYSDRIMNQKQRK